MALEKKVKVLVIEGDSQLVIRQIKGTYSCNNKRLQAYKKWVHDLREDFQAFNIKSIPRRRNAVADALATSASALLPLERTKLKRFSIELVATPSITDNITNF